MKYCKKILLAVVIIVVLITILLNAIRCSSLPENLDINDENITNIVIRNGTTGDIFIIEDENRVNDIIDEINNMDLKKVRKLENYSGWLIILDFNSKYGDIIYRLELKNSGIVYKGHFYSNGSEISLLGYFEDIFLFFP